MKLVQAVVQAKAADLMVIANAPIVAVTVTLVMRVMIMSIATMATVVEMTNLAMMMAVV